MMPPPGLRIYLRPRVTFHSLTPKVDRFMPPCPPCHPPWTTVTLGIIRCKNVMFTSSGTDERPDKRLGRELYVSVA